MSEEKSDLEKILGHHLIHKMETPPGGSPVVQFYRTRSNRFQFLGDRCRRCRRPPNVLYYDSRWGAVCDECHTREAAKRLEVILRLRRGQTYPLLESPRKEKPPAFFTRRRWDLVRERGSFMASLRRCLAKIC